MSIAGQSFNHDSRDWHADGVLMPCPLLRLSGGHMLKTPSFFPESHWYMHHWGYWWLLCRCDQVPHGRTGNREPNRDGSQIPTSQTLSQFFQVGLTSCNFGHHSHGPTAWNQAFQSIQESLFHIQTRKLGFQLHCLTKWAVGCSKSPKLCWFWWVEELWPTPLPMLAPHFLWTSIKNSLHSSFSW